MISPHDDTLFEGPIMERRPLPMLVEALRDWRTVLGSVLIIAALWAVLALGGR